MSESNVIDPQAIAIEELASGMVPMPEDFLPAMGPFANLYYAWQVLSQVLPVWVANLSAEGAEDIGDGGELVPALDAIAQAAGLITGACQMVSILPPDDQLPEVS